MNSWRSSTENAILPVGWESFTSSFIWFCGKKNHHLYRCVTSTKRQNTLSVVGIRRWAVTSQPTHPDEEYNIAQFCEFCLPLASYPCSFVDVQYTLWLQLIPHSSVGLETHHVSSFQCILSQSCRTLHEPIKKVSQLPLLTTTARQSSKIAMAVNTLHILYCIFTMPMLYITEWHTSNTPRSV